MGRKLGRYELIERLGRGGMGEVWRARDPALRRDVAVKVLRREGDEGATLRDDFVQRFLREARLAASLKHPNVVAIHDVGVDEEPYIVMEYVEGASLRGFIGDTTVRVEQRIAWLVEIARALAAAHEIGLVHRDIKPDNVMITKDGHAKVLDFGIAKAIGTDDDAPVVSRDAPESFRTQQGRVVGTPKYMAPEQLRGEAIDARVDQWAWACVAYELLVGSMPDRDETPQPISLTVPEVPFDAAAAIVRARSQAPEKRFDTMRLLLATFGAQTSGDIATISISTPPRRNPDAPTTTGPVRRPWRRAALVAFASFAVAGSVVFAVRHAKHPQASASNAPAPSCTFVALAPVDLGPLPSHFFSTVRPIVGGLVVGMLRSDEGATSEQLLTITTSEVKSRVSPPPAVVEGHPSGVFVLSPPGDARHYGVFSTADNQHVVVGRTFADDALVDVSRIIPSDAFKPVSISGFYVPHVDTGQLAFLVTGYDITNPSADRPAIRLYGRGFRAMKIFEGELEERPRTITVVTGTNLIGYAFVASNKLYVGSFQITKREEERAEPYGLSSRVETLTVQDARAPAVLGRTASQGAIAFDGDLIHLVWPELGASRLHHATIAADADAHGTDETFDVPTSDTSPELRIQDHEYLLAWHDGARVYFGEGDSVRAAASRAMSIPDATISMGPWMAHTPAGALVSWVSGMNNAVRRAILTCR